MEYTFIIQSTHSSLKGHFPNNPVIPGVVILDEVFNIIKTSKPEFTIDSIPMVKFIHPLLPEQKVIVEIKNKNETVINFSCSHNNTKLVTGQLVLSRLS